MLNFKSFLLMLFILVSSASFAVAEEELFVEDEVLLAKYEKTLPQDAYQFLEKIQECRFNVGEPTEHCVQYKQEEDALLEKYSENEMVIGAFETLNADW